MEPSGKTSIISAWRSALQVRNFQLNIIITILALTLCAVIAPVIFEFIQQREGVLLNDFLLNKIPTIDLSLWIFLILYTLIALSTISLAVEPDRFTVTLLAYVILTIFRFITLLLSPLEPPANIAVLSDPFVEQLFYQQAITKDLFFSGHTSLLVLLALALPNGIVRKIAAAGSVAIAAMLLIQHAHYTIDILFAPVFSWMALRLGKALTEKLYR